MGNNFFANHEKFQKIMKNIKNNENIHTMNIYSIRYHPKNKILKSDVQGFYQKLWIPDTRIIFQIPSIILRVDKNTNMVATEFTDNEYSVVTSTGFNIEK